MPLGLRDVPLVASVIVYIASPTLVSAGFGMWMARRGQISLTPYVAFTATTLAVTTAAQLFDLLTACSNPEAKPFTSAVVQPFALAIGLLVYVLSRVLTDRRAA